MAETKKVAEEKPKNILGKIKESIDDKEEQLAFLSTIVRLAVLVWSAGILTLAYVKLPAAFNIPEQKLDPTFIASVFKMQTYLKKIWSFLLPRHQRLLLHRPLGLNKVL